MKTVTPKHVPGVVVRRIGITLLAWLAPAALAQAQTPACADSTARALGHLAGTWDARTVFSTGTGWDTTSAVVTVAPDFQGCVLREELVGTRYGEPFRVLALWGAVGLQAPLQRTFTHSQHGLIGVYSGARTPSGVVLRDSQVVRGALVHFEHRFEPFTGDSIRFTSRRSTDGGASWSVSWYADYRRRAPK